MTDRIPVAIIGAGPFGLSVGAHLRELGGRVFGKPMQTWRESMPPGMLLRSAWDETSLSAPGGRGSIGEWARASGEPRVEPIPLETFLRYSEWFREQFVGELDAADIAQVEASEDGRFRLPPRAAKRSRQTALFSRSVSSPSSTFPTSFASRSDPESTSLPAHRPRDPARQEVAVVGGDSRRSRPRGSPSQAGAQCPSSVTQLRRARSADHEPHKPRDPLSASACIASPTPRSATGRRRSIGLFSCIPTCTRSCPGASLRRRLTRRLLRPGGSPWLRDPRRRAGDQCGWKPRLRGGSPRTGVFNSIWRTERRRHADNVLVATGYRFSLYGRPSSHRVFERVSQRRTTGPCSTGTFAR